MAALMNLMHLVAPAASPGGISRYGKAIEPEVRPRTREQFWGNCKWQNRTEKHTGFTEDFHVQPAFSFDKHWNARLPRTLYAGVVGRSHGLPYWVADLNTNAGSRCGGKRLSSYSRSGGVKRDMTEITVCPYGRQE